MATRYATTIDMKKLFLLVILSISSSCFACSFQFVNTPDIERVVAANNGIFPISDEHCAFLNKKGLAIWVSGRATVLGGVSIAWADARLIKLNRGVISDASWNSLKVDGVNPTQGNSDYMLYKALAEVVSRLDYVTAAGQVNSYLANGK